MIAAIDEQSLVQQLQQRKDVLETKLTSARRITVSVTPENYRSIVGYLAKQCFEHVIAATCIDAGENVELLLHLGRSTVITVKVKLPLINPEIESVVDLFPSMSIHEREAHDMMGIMFLNNPDLSRFMLSEDWPKDVYPLRKSFTPKVPEPVRRP